MSLWPCGTTERPFPEGEDLLAEHQFRRYPGNLLKTERQAFRTVIRGNRLLRQLVEVHQSQQIRQIDLGKSSTFFCHSSCLSF